MRPAIRVAAMDLLARREHSRRELVQKLGRRFAAAKRGGTEYGADAESEAGAEAGSLPGSQSASMAELIAAVVDTLAQENLQSDSRYAESFARQRVLRGCGPLRLRQEMRQKGILDEEVKQALDALEVDWEELAREVCQKKFGSTAPVDLKEKSRRQRFLQYRGFGPDQIAACLPW